MSELVSLQVRVEQPDTVVLSAVGELDLTNCHVLADAIGLNDTHETIVVDLTPCTFFDSTCLSLLYRTASQRQKEGKRFEVRVNEFGAKVITVAGLTDLLGITAPGASA